MTVPAAGEGTSIVALSDSSVISGSSGATSSPGATSTSMIGTSAKSPMSGTRTSIVSYTPGLRPVGRRLGLRRLLRGLLGRERLLRPRAVAGAAAPSSMRIAEPSDTVSPTATFSSRTTPACGAGTSIVALSDSSVISGSSGATSSPGATSTSMIGTSAKSPMSGTLISTMSAIRGAPSACR